MWLLPGPSPLRMSLSILSLSLSLSMVQLFPDERTNQIAHKISLHDAIMAAFAVMHLKYPSLLAFDNDRVQVFKNKDGSKGIFYLLCSGLVCDAEALKAVCKKW